MWNHNHYYQSECRTRFKNSVASTECLRTVPLRVLPGSQGSETKFKDSKSDKDLLVLLPRIEPIEAKPNTSTVVMEKQYSTALSDLVLALSALWGFRMLHEIPKYDFQFGKWWFMLVLLAASLGVINFGALLPSYHTSVVKYHKNFSWLCRAIGIPCLASEVCKLFNYPLMAQGFLLGVVITFITSSMKTHMKEKVTTVVNGLSIIAIIFFASGNGNYCLSVAGCLFILTAVVGSEGQCRFVNIPNVDILHYLLVAVNVFLTWGFSVIS